MDIFHLLRSGSYIAAIIFGIKNWRSGNDNIALSICTWFIPWSLSVELDLALLL